MKNLTSLLILFLLISTGLFAQSHVLLTGKIVNKKSKDPIAYAHIGIPEKGIGTTSGHDGKFRFKVPRRYANSDMIVSFMGYKTYRQPINTVTVPARIELVLAQNELPEIVVTDGDWVEDIVKKAVRAIPKNYPSHSTNSLAFYRESRTDDSLNYKYMSEGVLNIHKKSYTSQKEGQVALVQGRRMNFKNPLDTIIRGAIESGHMAAHRFDVVFNREDFINERYFPVYKYWLERMTTYKDRPVYVIGFGKDENAKPELFSGKKKKKKRNGLTSLIDVFRKNKKKKREVTETAKARLEGLIYIDMDSYAIIRTEFEVSKEGLRKVNDYPLYFGNWSMNRYVVNYRQLGEKWYFSDALREGNLRGKVYNNEIKVTEINTEKGKPLPYMDRLRRSESFSRLTGTYDPNFWESYNTTPLNAGQAEGLRQMENARKAQEAFDPEYMAALQRQRDSIRYAEEERIAQLRLESGETEIPSEFEMAEIGRINPERKKGKKRTRRSWVKGMLGAGTHFIQSEASPFNITYFSDEDEVIFSLEDDISNRNFEVVSTFDLDVFFSQRYFIRMGMSWDYYNSIYKDRTIGVGAEWNLSKQRPVYFKAILQYEKLKYARKVGVTDNDFGKFKFDGKKFNSESLNVYYGSRTRNLKFSGELSVELMPDRELYVRGSYHLPLGTRQEVWLKERRQVFRKKNNLAVSDGELSVTQNDTNFSNKIPNGGTFSVTVGLLFK